MWRRAITHARAAREVAVQGLPRNLPVYIIVHRRSLSTSSSTPSTPPPPPATSPSSQGYPPTPSSTGQLQAAYERVEQDVLRNEAFLRSFADVDPKRFSSVSLTSVASPFSTSTSTSTAAASSTPPKATLSSSSSSWFRSLMSSSPSPSSSPSSFSSGGAPRAGEVPLGVRSFSMRYIPPFGSRLFRILVFASFVVFVMLLSHDSSTWLQGHLIKFLISQGLDAPFILDPLPRRIVTAFLHHHRESPFGEPYALVDLGSRPLGPTLESWRVSGNRSYTQMLWLNHLATGFAKEERVEGPVVLTDEELRDLPAVGRRILLNQAHRLYGWRDAGVMYAAGKMDASDEAVEYAEAVEEQVDERWQPLLTAVGMERANARRRKKEEEKKKHEQTGEATRTVPLVPEDEDEDPYAPIYDWYLPLRRDSIAHREANERRSVRPVVTPVDPETAMRWARQKRVELETPVKPLAWYDEWEREEQDEHPYVPPMGGDLRQELGAPSSPALGSGVASSRQREREIPPPSEAEKKEPLRIEALTNRKSSSSPKTSATMTTAESSTSSTSPSSPSSSSLSNVIALPARGESVSQSARSQRHVRPEIPEWMRDGADSASLVIMKPSGARDDKDKVKDQPKGMEQEKDQLVTSTMSATSASAAASTPAPTASPPLSSSTSESSSSASVRSEGD